MVSPPPVDSDWVFLRDGAGTVLSRLVTKSPESTVYTMKTTAARSLLIRLQTGLASYLLRLEDVGPEDHGDTHTTATPLALGQTVRGSLELTGDRDLFALSLAARQRYVLTTDSTTVRFRVYAAAEAYVALTSSGPPPFAFTTSGAGTYFVEVSDPGSNGVGTALPYEFTVQ